MKIECGDIVYGRTQYGEFIGRASSTRGEAHLRDGDNINISMYRDTITVEPDEIQGKLQPSNNSAEK